MMRYRFALAVLIFACAVQVYGQEKGGATLDRIDFTFGTAFMHFGGPPSFNSPSIDFGSQYHMTNWLGYAGQLCFGVGPKATVHTFALGPEVILRRRVSPFAHILIGVSHLSQNSHGDTSLGALAGGGIILNLQSRITWRAFELDYAPTYFRGGRQDTIRVSTGFTLRF